MTSDQRVVVTVRDFLHLQYNRGQGIAAGYLSSAGSLPASYAKNCMPFIGQLLPCEQMHGCATV
jgi:hypothetical protein